MGLENLIDIIKPLESIEFENPILDNLRAAYIGFIYNQYDTAHLGLIENPEIVHKVVEWFLNQQPSMGGE